MSFGICAGYSVVELALLSTCLLGNLVLAVNLHGSMVLVKKQY